MFFDMVTVGGTINVMLGRRAPRAPLSSTRPRNPHRGPGQLPQQHGRASRGAGTDVIRIRGMQHLHHCTYTVIPDQIETGTLMIAAAATLGM